MDDQVRRDEVAAARPLRGVDLLLVLVVALVLLILALAVAMLGLGIDFQFEDDQSQPVIVGLSFAVIQAIAVMLPIYVLVMRRRRLSLAALGLKPVAPIWYLYAVLLVVILIPLNGLINRLILPITGDNAFEMQTQFLASDEFSWTYLALSLLVVGAIVPFVEELAFRGLFYRWLRQRWRMWICLVVSGVVFGLFHGHPGLIPATAILGIAFAYLFERSGSLWPAIVAHGVHNSLNISLIYLAHAFDWQIQ